MTLDVNDTEKRAGVWIADGPTRQPLVARTGPAETADAARVLSLNVENDAGAPR